MGQNSNIYIINKSFKNGETLKLQRKSVINEEIRVDYIGNHVIQNSLGVCDIRWGLIDDWISCALIQLVTSFYSSLTHTD
jgi:hypothetical protein